MANAHKLLLADASGAKSRAAGALRPGVEALLLAAVALGCAQTGWSVLAPRDAGARGVEPGASEDTGAMLEIADVQSPFAPDAEASSSSHAIDALLSTVQLAGVRMAGGDALSGAYLTMGDGAQRAFLVGQTVAEGVTLADVGADYILLAYGDEERQLRMTAGPSFSFARAMMGLEPAPGAPALRYQEQPLAADASASVAQADAQAVHAFAAASETAQQTQPAVVAALQTADAAWLAATLQQVQVNEGQLYGWRVAEPLPALAQAAGLRAGDVIVSVNGAGPAQAADVLSAAQAQDVEVTVERAGARFVVDLANSG